MEDFQLTPVTHDWNKISAEDIGFDADTWEDLINSDEVFTEQFSKSINTIDSSNVVSTRTDIVKLLSGDLTRSTFLNSDKLIHTDRPMTILIPPSANQRVRYENECVKTIRYISVPNNKTMTIEIPDLRNILVGGDVLWMRITRTTIDHRRDRLIFYHPYPIWLRGANAKIHNGSIFIQITDTNMKNGFIEIGTLAMIRLKQEVLAKVDTLAVYSSTKLNLFDQHSIELKTSKRIRDEYKLRQSVLHFQLVRVDQNNTAYLTDCLCQTETFHEIEANAQQQVIQPVKTIKRKKSNKRKKN